MATTIKCVSKVLKLKVYSTNIISCKYWSNIYKNIGTNSGFLIRQLWPIYEFKFLVMKIILNESMDQSYISKWETPKNYFCYLIQIWNVELKWKLKTEIYDWSILSFKMIFITKNLNSYIGQSCLIRKPEFVPILTIRAIKTIKNLLSYCVMGLLSLSSNDEWAIFQLYHGKKKLHSIRW
jgi:hypothetical protein